MKGKCVKKGVHVNGHNMSVRVAGWGEPVILVHCSSSSNAQWGSLTETLSGEFSVFAPDQWGCGQSDSRPGKGAFTLAEEAGPIIDILKHIGVPAHVVGHSYGGGVALHIALEQPHLVRSLTLVEPSVFHLLKRGIPTDRALFSEIFDVAETIRNAVAARDPHTGMNHFVDYWNGARAWARMPKNTRDELVQRLDKVALDFQALFDEPADLNDYAELSHPTLILCAERSPEPSRRIVEMLVRAMPNARAELVSGAGHMSPITHPDDVNRAIRLHLLRYRAFYPSRITMRSIANQPEWRHEYAQSHLQF